MKDVTVHYLHSYEKITIFFSSVKHDIFLEREGYFMKKNMYSVLLHFFLFVCLVIPLHTTANAANTTDDCLQILTSDFNSNSAQEFIGTQQIGRASCRERV